MSQSKDKDDILIYMDNCASTMPHPSIRDLLGDFSMIYGNPSSKHIKGIMAKKVLDKARNTVASYMDVSSSEIIYTSSATEANNLALKGIALPGPSRIVTTTVEHPSVIVTCRQLSNMYGCQVDYVSVDNKCIINLIHLEKLLAQKNVDLVSIIGANNVTGVIQPIRKIAAITKKYKVPLHVDMTQLFGKVLIYPKKLGIDMMSFSGHKFHCIRGIGCLYLSSKIKINPLITGGMHEEGRRAGTENLLGIAAMSMCLNINLGNINRTKKVIERVKYMRDYIEQYLVSHIPNLYIVGKKALERLYNVSCLCMPGIDNSVLTRELNRYNICVSVGSACSYLSKGDHVLEAMKIPPKIRNGMIRISLSEYNTMKECRYVCAKIVEIVIS